ncbi:hypothetical protein COCOBI_04-2940 [Coccomyxa sp. Obi]|nr:hypothetical protein COCOBI_04-2940 [Coccomyxa sp. Obi]
MAAASRKRGGEAVSNGCLDDVSATVTVSEFVVEAPYSGTNYDCYYFTDEMAQSEIDWFRELQRVEQKIEEREKELRAATTDRDIAILENEIHRQIERERWVRQQLSALQICLASPSGETKPNVKEYLHRELGPIHDDVRKLREGFYGRLPLSLRDSSAPLVTTVKTALQKDIEVTMGQQMPITARSDVVRVFISFAATIQDNWLNGSGDHDYLRSMAFMSLLGSPGAGESRKTTMVVKLPRLVYDYMKLEPEDAQNLILAALEQRATEKYVKATYNRLLSSLQPGRLLVSYFGVNTAPQLLPEEEKLSWTQRLALRALYGACTWLDPLPGASPLGTYERFLHDINPDVRRQITLDDYYDFMEARCGISEDTPCMHLLALDEANAALKEFREGTTTWVQEGSAALLLDTHGQRAKRRLPIILAANSRHSEVSLTPIKATQQAKTGVLPLRAPTLSEGQELWVAIIERLSLTMTDMDLPEEADVSDPTSGFNFLCRLCGANFRCMAWILEILGGSSGRGGWTHAELASSIAGPKMLRVDSLKEDPLGNLLRDLHAKVYGARWFTSEKWRDKDADDRWHVLTQTVAHAMLGISVRLVDCIPGSGLQWALVVADGLAHALYAERAGQELSGVASEYISMHSLSISRSPAGDPVYETQPEGSPVPSRRSPGAPAILPAHAGSAGGSEPMSPAHARSAGGSEAEPSTPAAQTMRGDRSTSQKMSPKYRIHAMLGMLTVSGSATDPMQVPATLVVAPATLTALWPSLEFPNGPLADVVYHEDAYRREEVDVQAVHLSVYLLKAVLKEETASYASLVKGGWLSPVLHTLNFTLPDNLSLLKRIARVNKDWTEMERWKAIVKATGLAASTADDDAGATAAAEAAAKEADMNCASYAVIGPGNAGTDGFLQLRSDTNQQFKIFSQSKKSEVDSTTTLEGVFEEMQKDLRGHGYVAAKLVTSVPALERMPYMVGAGKRRRGGCSPPQGWPGGTLQRFVEVGMAGVLPESLEYWREQLQDICNTKASAGKTVVVAGDLDEAAVQYDKPKEGEAKLEALHDFSYHYITDRRLTPDQHRRHQVLALAGHELAARLVVVDRSCQEQFYGTATAIQRQVAAMRSGRSKTARPVPG